MQPVDDLTIRPALDRILSSAAFARNERQSRFLRFLVERHLDGREHELKESVIALEVFDRPADYDPKVDAIVRTEAVRLRARLEKYYEGEGRQDPVVIELPKGGYRPVFRERPGIPDEAGAPPAAAAPAAATTVRGLRKWLVAGAVAAIPLVGGTTWWWMRPKPVVVAVLPLENLNKDPEMDYFTDGLTDEVIRSLSVIEGLTVRAGTSSFALKGKGLNAVEAGAQLDADYLVEGAVLQAGDQLRVNVALVEAREGARVWSNRYDRKLTDVFAIQDEISRGVVTTLQLRVSGRRRYEANLEAYDLYLRGRQIMAAFPSGRGRSVAMPAVEFFQSAIEKDPNYAIAYAGMADAFIAVERNMGASNTVDAWPRAKAAAASALERDPMLSEAHAAMAAIRAREYGWQDAERAFRRAIELNPNNALAHLELGVRVLAIQARIDEGLAEVRRAVALDPLSPYVNTEAGESLILAGRYDEAVARFRKAIDLDPNRPRPYHLLARVLCLQGNAAAAQDAIDQSFKRGAVAIPWLACVAFKTGRREQALALLDQVRSSDSSYRMAWIYACLGDEQALSALEQVSAQNGPRLPELLRSPEFAFLRSNPRFAALLTKVNLER